MKTIKIFTVLTFLVIFSAGIAAAELYTWTDVIDWDPDRYIEPRQSFSYTHDITDGQDGFSGYLMGGDDIIWDYSITVSLYDDEKNDFFEIASIDQPGLIGDGFYDFHYDNQEFGWSLMGLFSLNRTGELDVNINSWSGDFFFDQSVFVATGDNGSDLAPVPEPATIILFGSGLLGVATIGRKNLGKNKTPKAVN
jgi:hypothetical protein